MAAVRNECCCMHIKTCATLVGMLGLLGAVVAVFLPFHQQNSVVWLGSPFTFVVLCTYVFILVGVNQESHGCMLAAEIMLGILVAFSVLQSILVLILVFFSKKSLELISQRYKFDYHDFEEYASPIFVIFFLLTLFELVWNIYSFIVVRQARKWFKENSMAQQPIYTYGYGMAPSEIRIQSSGQPQQSNADASGTLQVHAPNNQPPQNFPSVYPQLETTPTAPLPEPQGGYVNAALDK
uniref:Uncharacterized protein n=1 Tax=Panagrolaimus davidi TaxID=227884 RepID=A0A914P5P3_9BILA